MTVVPDLAVGAVSDDDVASSAGAIYILFMNADGTVASEQKITGGVGGFPDTLNASDRFGSGIAALGDLDGDGVEDIAVGASGDDDGGTSAGGVFILFMNDDGTVSSTTHICHGTSGFSGDLSSGSPEFGVAVAPIGDLNGDTNMDLVVGAFGDDDGGGGRGAAYVLFLNSDGTVSADQKISDLAGGFTGTLDDNDNFGVAVGAIGDLDGDTNEDIIVAARLDDDGGGGRGAVYVLFLDSDGTVLSHQKISSTTGGFSGGLDDADYFGTSVDRIGDINNDGIEDIAVGCRGDDDGSSASGAIWILFLDTDGTVLGEQKISALEGGLTGPLTGDEFGYGVTSMGDLDGDGRQDIAVGERYRDDGGSNRGAAWILFLDDCTVDADFTASDLMPCEDIGLVTLTNTSENPFTQMYDWKVDDVSFSSAQDTAYIFTTPGTHEIKLIATKENCPGVDSLSMTFDVIASPTSSFEVWGCTDYTVPSGDETYVVGGVYMDTIPSYLGCDSIMTITVNIGDEDPTFSYEASYCSGGDDPLPTIDGTPGGTFSATPAGLVIDGASGEIDVSVSTPAIYTIKYVTPSATCPDSSTVVVEIIAGDDAIISYAESSYCTSDSNPTPTITGTAGGNFSATPAGLSFVSTTTGEIDLAGSSAGVYDVKYLTTSAVCPDSSIVTITIGEETTATIDTTICGGTYMVPSGDETYSSTGMYMDTIPNAAGCDSVLTINLTVGTDMTASIDASACDSYTVPSGDETYTTTGVYMDTIPTVLGCDSVLTINLTIGAVDVSVTTTDTTLTANASGGSITYQWIDCATLDPVAGATSQTFEPTQNGSYAVIITDGTCVDTSDCYDIEGIGFDENERIDFSVYPNPTDGLITLELSENYDQMTIRLMDLSGRLILEDVINSSEKHQLQIDGEAGIYLLEITADGKRSFTRVVKH